VIHSLPDHLLSLALVVGAFSCPSNSPHSSRSSL
jgi:hypothetical protein